MRTTNVTDADLVIDSEGWRVYVQESADLGWFYSVYRKRVEFVDSKPGFATREEAIEAARAVIGPIAANPSTKKLKSKLLR